MLRLVQEVSRVQLDDGLKFDAAGASADAIRDEDAYSGVRVTLTGTLSVAKLAFHVDVNVGDPIWPAPQRITLPRLLEGQIIISGYPLAMVHAEKVVTAVHRGVANTRWRDFADIHALVRRHDINGAELTTAIERVAQHRQVRLAPLAQVLDGYPALAQQRWAAWRRKAPDIAAVRMFRSCFCSTAASRSARAGRATPATTPGRSAPRPGRPYPTRLDRPAGAQRYRRHLNRP